MTTDPAEETEPLHLLALALNGLGYHNIMQSQESAVYSKREKVRWLVVRLRVHENITHVHPEPDVSTVNTDVQPTLKT